MYMKFEQNHPDIESHFKSLKSIFWNLGNQGIKGSYK